MACCLLGLGAIAFLIGAGRSLRARLRGEEPPDPAGWRLHPKSG